MSIAFALKLLHYKYHSVSQNRGKQEYRRNWQTRTTQKLVRQNCNSLQQKPKAKQAFSRCPEVAFKKILRGTPA